MRDAAIVRLLKELRRRRVFRVAGLYVVALWLLMQAANILFPAWGIPDAAITYLLWAGLLGFPVALVFGWLFDISTEGIRRTQPVSSQDELLRSLPLRRADFVILSAFLVVLVAIVYDTTGRVMQTATYEGWRPSLAEIEPNSVAVLPFADLSPERDQEYFTDGISEEILNRLSAFRELKVIARTSSFTFKDSGYDIARISGLLAVNYLLQGSVRRDGEQLRIAAQLVDRSGVQVWSESFDRELGGIFALQDEIAEAVATRIVPQIVPPATAPRLPDFEAYQAYLTGRELIARRSPGWDQAAIEHLNQAIEFDPEFAEPYAELAIVLAIGWDPTVDPELRRQRAWQNVDRALVLKPELARGFAVQALLMDVWDQRRTHAEREALLKRSLALDPNQVDALNWLAAALEYQGKWEESEEVFERALRLDPLAPIINVNMARREIQRGAFAAAERRLLRVLEAPRPAEVVYLTLGGLYGRTGRYTELAALQERRILDALVATGWPEGLIGRILLFATLGMRTEVDYWRNKNRELHRYPMIARVFELAVLSLETGLLDYAEALHQFEELTTTGVLEIDHVPREAAIVYGELLALDGRYERAQAVLEPQLDSVPGRADPELETRVRLALAWTHLGRGRPELAAGVVEPRIRDFREADAAGRLHFSGGEYVGALSGGLAGYAMAVLLSGDDQRALELLERATEAGWRSFYGALRDPRWDAVRDEPRFQAVMARVKADLDAQRAKLEADGGDKDFILRFEAALASRPENANGAGQAGR